MRRPDSVRLADTELLLRPFSVSGRLPDWSPQSPPSDWSPADAWAAALAYAEDAAPRHTRSVAKSAYQCLLAAVPGLKRAEIDERLAGINHFVTAFAHPREYLDEDPPPF
ncbi:hypothetical protein [Arthrobacter zhaoguopingii]|uniref:hypothetical protein n=1 Tax=Arthrobacter zhaoguopingii TaxID=2681491 RepID=UPI0013577C08|nr:hypothetical protein [Arthrobacter zhaoguopingii]